MQMLAFSYFMNHLRLCCRRSTSGLCTRITWLRLRGWQEAALLLMHRGPRLSAKMCAAAAAADKVLLTQHNQHP